MAAELLQCTDCGAEMLGGELGDVLERLRLAGERVACHRCRRPGDDWVGRAIDFGCAIRAACARGLSREQAAAEIMAKGPRR